LTTLLRKIVPQNSILEILFEMVKNIEVVFGKGRVKGQKRKKTPTLTDIPFKKQSIFLPSILEGSLNLPQH
jgi:hypothetical protein